MPTGIPEKSKKCAICGELFIPKHPANTICSKTHYAKCPICGKDVVWNTTKKIRPCCKECSSEQRRRTSFSHYGTLHPMQSKEVQMHHADSMRSHYGVDYPMQSSDLRAKMSETTEMRYGVKWPVFVDAHPKEIKEICAASCVKYKMSQHAAAKFWRDNRMDDVADKGLLSLGLVYKGRLASMMTFGPSDNPQFAVELLGAKDSPYYVVSDGPQVLFNWAIEYFGLANIVGYCYPDSVEQILFSRLCMKFSGSTRRGQLIYTK